MGNYYFTNSEFPQFLNINSSIEILRNFIKLKNYLEKKNYLFLKRLSNYKFSDRPDYGDYLFKKKI